MQRIWLFLFIIFVVINKGCSNPTDRLIQDLYSNSSQIKRRAARKLGSRVGDRETVQKVIALLDKDNEEVAYIATQIIGSLADSSAVKPLGRMTEHKNFNIRASACWSMGSIGHNSALPYLVKALKDSVSSVRYSAVVALGHIHDLDALEYIYPMFRDEADSVRVRAVQSLYYYRAVKGSKIMGSDFTIPLTDKSDVVRYVAVQALGGAWDQVNGWLFADSTVAGELLIETLKDESKSVRIEAITSLGKIHYKKAVPVLKEMYDRSSIDEEYKITEVIKEISGEVFPPSDQSQ